MVKDLVKPGDCMVGQNRSEGRPQPPEVPSISVAGQPLSVPLSTV